MTRPRVLVITTVHHADDNRIREKTIRSLAEVMDVVYAARLPRPEDTTGLKFRPLRGGRAVRIIRAASLAFFGRHDIISVHDPELIPIGLLARIMRRTAVVVDLHEDVPAQILTKDWIPPRLRRLVSAVARQVIRMAERVVVITIAEPDYAQILRRDHVVIPNAPRMEALPAVVSDRQRQVVYVGDVTSQRGVFDAIRACAIVGIPLVLVGPLHDLESSLRRAAEIADVPLTLTGRLSHPEAMKVVAASAVAVSPLHDLPNYRESVPTKLLEYLALGVPVVASDLPATRRAVEGLIGVELVKPGDPAAIASGILRSLDQSILTSVVTQAQLVRRERGWDSATLQEVYLGALEGRPHSAGEETPTPRQMHRGEDDRK